MLTLSYQSFSQTTDKAKLLQFEEAITRAEEYLQAKDYPKAKAEYQKALLIDPLAKYPKDKLAQIRKVYIDPQDEKDFQLAIQKGDQYMASSDYAAAKEQFSSALLIKPDDRATREKAVNADKLAAVKNLMLKEYENLITSGDKLFDANDYQEAITVFEQAKQLNNKDTYASMKIIEAQNILTKNKLLDDEYNNVITEADEAYMNREFKSAQNKYEQALKLKPDESYPKNMLGRVKESMANQVTNDAQQQKLLAEKHKQDSINAIATAKELELQHAEETKIRIAQEAEQAKLQEQELAEQTRLREEKLAEEAKLQEEQLAEQSKLQEEQLAEQSKLQEEQLAEQARIDSANYANAEKVRLAEEAKMELQNKHIQDSINAADQAAELALREKEIEEEQLAQSLAQKAEDERLFKEKEEAATHEAELKAQQELIAQQLAAEEKRKELELSSEIDKEYLHEIEEGNRLYKEQDLTSAVIHYEKASELKPTEEYPKDKLLDIHNTLLERLKNNLDVYNKFIASADLLYQSNIFDQALDEYEKAIVTRPEETYPALMIEKIRLLMKENAMVDLVTSSTTISDNNEQKYKFVPIEMKLRKNNYIIIKARKTSENPPKLFINYGKDTQKSGGIVLKGIESDETVDYLIRISTQDKWYRVDNNWIGLYPEGGSLEITSMQISQGDIQKVKPFIEPASTPQP